MKALAPLNDKGFYTCLFVFVYDLPTVLLAYDPFEDAGGFPFHFVGVVGVEVLGDGGVGVSEAGGYVDGFGTCFDEFCRVGMTEAVRVESHGLQDAFEVVVPVGGAVRFDTDEGAADVVRRRCHFLGQEDAPVFRVFIDELVCLSEAHFVRCLCRTQGAQVAEEGAVGVEGAGAAFGFWCLEVAGVEELLFFQSA